MKIGMLLFLLLPLAGCSYVGWHVWRVLPLGVAGKWLVVIGMVACLGLLFLNVGMGLDRWPLPVARVLYAVGSSSVVILLYLVMLFLLLDVGRLAGLVPDRFLHDSLPGTLTILGIMAVVFGYGRLHYEQKVRVPLTLQARQLLATPFKMVLVSDLHLGYHNTRADLARWIDLINAEHPDLVLIAGDIVDISVRPLWEEGMAMEFRRLTAPVYACLGNHDYYAGEPRSEQFYRESGIRLLRDSSVAIPLSGDARLLVVGRDDRTNSRRRPVADLVEEARGNLSRRAGADYVVLLDHQPYHLERASKAGVDFQFSGHTHYGQVWPISWVEDWLYEDAYGALRKDHTDFSVTSGLGIWGGKFRIGTQSEYVVATLQ